MNPSPTSSDTARQPRRRSARGPARPQYLTAADTDHVLAMLLTLAAEVSALRERLDTHERLAAQAVPVAPSAAAVEAYVLDDAQRAERELARQGMLKRVLRVIYDEREAAGLGVAQVPHPDTV